nr:serine protease [Bacillota bacterium]
MGFYDDGFSAPPRRRGVSRVWVPLLSGIAGGLVVFFGLVAAGWGPLQPAPIGDTSPAPSGPSEHRTINVDVNTAIADAVAKVEKAVVGVVTVQEDFWSTQSVDREVGSGFVFERVNGRAHIATNYHVVETAANGEGRLEVVLPNGARVRNVKLLGVDPFMDL